MKNRFFSIVLFIVLAFSSTAFAVEESSAEHSLVTPLEEISDEHASNQTYGNNIDETAPETYTEESSLPYKQPISKRKLIKKFLLAMFAVGISSIFLYTTLSVYGKFKSINIKQVKTPENTTPLVTPDDFKSAAKTFLDKTDWD